MNYIEYNLTLEHIKSFIRNENYDNALNAIIEFVEAVNACKKADGKIICLPVLDNLCQEIGEKIINLQDFPPETAPHTKSQIKLDKCFKSEGERAYTLVPDLRPALKKHEGSFTNEIWYHVVFLATKLYKSGGHTAVIEDFIKTYNKLGIACTIIVTDLIITFNKLALKRRFLPHNVKIIFIEDKSLVTKTHKLISNLASIKPSHIYLFNHPQDAVITTAIQKSLPGKKFFYHHADFKLCLGVSLNHCLHLDFNINHVEDCKNHFSKHNRYVPLTYEKKSDETQNYDNIKSVITATVANHHKLSDDYYHDIADIITATKSKHIHIGKIPRTKLSLIKENLKNAGIKRNKFKHIKYTTSVELTLIKEKVALYICSYPVGGGRTAIEVLSAGIPFIYHDNPSTPFLNEHNEIFKGLSWQSKNELISTLEKLSIDKLKDLGKKAYSHYKKYYQPTLLKKLIKSDFSDDILIDQKIPLILYNYGNKYEIIEEILLHEKTFQGKIRKSLRKLLRCGWNIGKKINLIRFISHQA